ncbi:BTAD domain-containing putative transcriptional regulator [Fodinicola feengrottensis]|uniref:BTAD domain-containing putative transcriptional regulator n=1 Tax=Fodinicola feengrottensis TaxID=435914 RepID=A0ABP4SIC6_9ACTN
MDAGQPRQRTVLAALLVDAGRVVSAEVLIDRVWGEEPPQEARNSLNAHLSRIRHILADAGNDCRLLHQSGGYLLDAAPAAIDALHMRQLISQARMSGSDSERIALLRAAVQLWRGEPLAGLSGSWVTRTRLALGQQYVDAMVAWGLVEVRIGDPTAAVGPLTELAGEFPLAESVSGALIQALAATGRTGDALNLYTTVRQRLVDELGTDPGAELQAAHQQVLRGHLGSAPPVPLPRITASTGPHQLPPTVPQFAGRAAELAALTNQAHANGTVLITAIGGTAGVGKTALAVHGAHQIADRFPDGHLYVNLRGFDPAGPLDPADAIRAFLEALGVASQRIPLGLDERAARYRSEVSGRRLLILLDNARDTAQVRPLLPGTPSCLVLVTSRNQLTGLVAVDGARPVSLDLLSETDAVRLLINRLGQHRVQTEPAAVADIITRCARLPLALAVVAARAALQPHLPLHVLASELADHRLDLLAGDDPNSDLRAVFSWSYRALTPPTARLFRLLGHHPGPDITVPAAASLAGVSPTAVHQSLTELSHANLIVEHRRGRYAFHDLLRAYAAELRDEDPQATRRMLDYYLHAAYGADRVLHPTRDSITLDPPRSDTIKEDFADPDQALAWFTAEHDVLLAAVEHSAATGYDAHTWQLAWALLSYLDRRGLWNDWVTTSRTAVTAADRLGNPAVQARTHRNLAAAYTELALYPQAHTELQQALALYEKTGDLAGQARTHYTLAFVWGRQNDQTRALDHAEQSLLLHQATGHLVGQADAVNAVGWHHAQLGDHDQARDRCQQALALHERLGNRDGQAHTWDSLGYIHHHLGNQTAAINSYQRAVAMFRELGDRHGMAATLTHLADIQHGAGDDQNALTAYQKALTIFVELNHPDADQIRTTLATIARAEQ